MKKILIIGGGLAGLSVGNYLQMNGYDTEIFEFYRAGGLCTSWKRKGYTIDGCIHWLVGINPQDQFYPSLNELLDIDNIPKIVYEEFCSMEMQGHAIHFWGNLDKFEEELKTISPQDSIAIEGLMLLIRKMISFSLSGDKAYETMNPLEKLHILGKMVSMRKIFNTWKIPLDEFAQKFKNPLIKKFLSLFSWWEAPILGIIMNAAWLHNKNSCYPLGGPETLINRLVKKYQSLGGVLHENAKIAKIIVEDKAAKGVILQNGKIYISDDVISAADGHETIVNMLGEQYADETTKALYFTDKYVPKKSQVYISLGIARPFKESFKPYLYFFLKNPLNIGKTEVTNIGVTIHNFDPTSAPCGKTLITIMIPIYDIGYWTKLHKDNPAEYKAQKDSIAQHIIKELDLHFGNIKNNVEMIDVATPVTYMRYTNNWNGAPMAWQDYSLAINKPHKEIKGLKHFFMCGHWLGDQGIAGALKSGRDLAQIICKRDGNKFTSKKNEKLAISPI
jgi:phytoene dehydrogenase-like protein